ncbi:MAG: hypothetical protein AAFY67_19005 [Cyanobacteria bacterium J06642_9]
MRLFFPGKVHSELDRWNSRLILMEVWLCPEASKSGSIEARYFVVGDR